MTYGRAIVGSNRKLDCHARRACARTDGDEEAYSGAWTRRGMPRIDKAMTCRLCPMSP
jgi:hypothetical protein